MLNIEKMALGLYKVVLLFVDRTESVGYVVIRDGGKSEIVRLPKPYYYDCELIQSDQFTMSSIRREQMWIEVKNILVNGDIKKCLEWRVA